MIHAKNKGHGKTQIEIDGSDLELVSEMFAVVDSVSKVIFKDDEKMRTRFLKDLPEVVLNMQARFTATKSLFSPEELKKILEEEGGND